MKTIKKFLPIIAIAIMVVIVIIGLFFIGKGEGKSRYDLIPKNATAVAYIKPSKLSHVFYELIKRDPTIMDSVTNSKIDLKQVQSNNSSPGINPLSDLIVFYYSTSKTEFENLGIILNVIDKSKFIQSMSATKIAKPEKYSSGSILEFEKDKLYALNNGDNTYVILKSSKTNISKAIAQQQFDLIFGENKQSLSEIDESFNTFISTEKQLGVWSDGNSKFVKQLTSIISIFENMNEKSLSFNMQKDRVDIKSIIDLKTTDFYVKNNEEKLILNKNEIAKFSLTSTPKYVNNILEKVFNPKQQYILNYCTGGMCGGVIGYRNTPAFTTKIEQIIDPNTFETVEKLKKVEVSPRLNLPEIMYALQIEKPTELFALLNTDTLVNNETGYWTINHPLFIDEYIYLTLKNNLLYVGTNQNFESLTPQFTTLGFIANIPKAIENYPPKNTIQQIGMAAIPEIKFQSIDLNFNRIEGQKMYLEGSIKMTDTSQHSMLIILGEILKFRSLLKGLI